MLSAERRFQTWLRDSLPGFCAAGCFLVVLAAVAALTGKWCWMRNGYNSYALQADAWLHGRLDLGQDYPWLELAIYQGRYYVSFPPFPSYLLLPFSAVFGTDTPDGWISLFASLVGVWTAVRLAQRAGQTPTHAVLLTLFLYLGTGYLFIALTPAVWFFAQTLCFNLCMLSLYFAMTDRGGFSLTCWACAVGCRPMVLVFFPLLALLILKSHRQASPRDSLLSLMRKRWYWALGPILIGGSYMALNFLRFGSVLQFGHDYLPEFQRAPLGQFSLQYFWENFRNLFRLPGLNIETHRLDFQPFEVWCFALMNPLSVLCIAVPLLDAVRKRDNRPVLILAVVLSLVYVVILCCHRTLGGWQFGNRYMKDFMPFLFAALCLSAPGSRRFRMLIIFLFVAALALHLAGTVLTWNNAW